jgi:hypothetical protein
MHLHEVEQLLQLQKNYEESGFELIAENLLFIQYKKDY